MSPINIAAIAFALSAGVYLVLFLVGSVFGMHEEDNLYLSVGESRLAAEQHETMKTINKINLVTRWVGFVALSLGVVLAGLWSYSVVQILFVH
jgi:hypothetical protein